MNSFLRALKALAVALAPGSIAACSSLSPPSADDV